MSQYRNQQLSGYNYPQASYPAATMTAAYPGNQPAYDTYAAYPAPPAYGQSMGYYPQPAHQMVMPKPVRKYNKKLDFTIGEHQGEKAVWLHNVELPHQVGILSRTLRFNRGEPNSLGKMPFTFKPDGNSHSIDIMNYGKSIKKVNLKAQPAKLKTQDTGEKELLVENLYNKRNLVLRSDNKLDWHLKSHPSKKNAYFLRFEPYDQVHNVTLSVKRDNKEIPVQGGKLTLAPKNPPAPQMVPQAYHQQAPQAYYGPPPPTYYAPPPGPMYAHPQYRSNALMAPAGRYARRG